MKTVMLFVLWLISIRVAYSKELLPYKNPDLPLEVRVKDLISRMTLDEKLL